MIPEGLKTAWQKAEEANAEGEHDQALEILRGAWAEFPEEADHATTWFHAAEAERAISTAGDKPDRKLMRKAHDHYQKTLKHDPKHRAARRGDNALLVAMDGLGFRATSMPRLWADGTPTMYGIFAIFVVGMLMLTTLKYLPEIKAALSLSSESSDNWDATLTIELYPQAASKTVASFKQHAQEGNYNDIAFHRVIDGFMVQGGDVQFGEYPLNSSTLAGTGGYSAIWYGQGQQNDATTWTMPDEFHPSYRNVPGAISMANSGPDTGGSQFFLIDKDSEGDCTEDGVDNPTQGTCWLDDMHSVFGFATAGTYLGTDIGGVELINRLSQVPVGTGDQPVDPPYIHSIEINDNIALMHLVFP
jgi:peptidyl-prolyl cis-trans isomerase B (cyclophilin B)